jgi:hypothetical protein
LNDPTQFRIKRVLTIRLIKTVKTVGPADQKSDRAEFPKLILHRMQCQTAGHRKLPDVLLLPRRGEK